MGSILILPKFACNRSSSIVSLNHQSFLPEITIWEPFLASGQMDILCSFHRGRACRSRASNSLITDKLLRIMGLGWFHLYQLRTLKKCFAVIKIFRRWRIIRNQLLCPSLFPMGSALMSVWSLRMCVVRDPTPYLHPADEVCLRSLSGVLEKVKSLASSFLLLSFQLCMGLSFLPHIRPLQCLTHTVFRPLCR